MAYEHHWITICLIYKEYDSLKNHSKIFEIINLCLTGTEYPAVVEFAPYPRISKKKNKRSDPRKGTIEQGEFDKIYKKFI